MSGPGSSRCVSENVTPTSGHVTIDGDSASLAELCALLSALSRLPLAQHVAVTGAIDQCGQVLAIGGLNEKLEAWFRATHAIRGSGPFAAVIPSSNQRDLMLGDAAIEAARADRFQVYPVESVDEAIPILFGVPASRLHTKVVEELERLNARAKR